MQPGDGVQQRATRNQRGSRRCARLRKRVLALVARNVRKHRYADDAVDGLVKLFPAGQQNVWAQIFGLATSC